MVSMWQVTNNANLLEDFETVTRKLTLKFLLGNRRNGYTVYLRSYK